ncbi:RHS repeat protein [Victivallis sp. Marseille-Q1083]|uniref:RHS repeat protein n=1 Tax=Victivallis sp. Marseille-Q1083 TaxID=2717288 RepID=UPI001C37A1D6|nr:RHS repeat-associated core domain-containing protein [Victivallis sp. Marseille-Q1083]
MNAVNQYSLITEPNGTTYAQVHDADGNLTGSYTTQYTYDAENRLKTADVGTYRYEYTYDYLSRRIRQKVILKSGATGQTQSEVAYVYDGWNVVGVYDTTTAAPTFQKGYLWGEDLSGNLQGAGGVGGLLAEKRGGQTYLPVYDGNGNIMSYLNASTKASVAEYIYDAFGRTISSSGAEADNFTYRFSTKPVDGNGLYYYGYRYYDPQHGRWISRDPLEEEGGINLYGFVQNNGVMKYDLLGTFVLSPGYEYRVYAGGYPLWGSYNIRFFEETLQETSSFISKKIIVRSNMYSAFRTSRERYDYGWGAYPGRNPVIPTETPHEMFWAYAMIFTCKCQSKDNGEVYGAVELFEKSSSWQVERDWFEGYSVDGGVSLMKLGMGLSFNGSNVLNFERAGGSAYIATGTVYRVAYEVGWMLNKTTSASISAMGLGMGFPILSQNTVIAKLRFMVQGTCSFENGRLNLDLVYLDY